MFHSPCRDFLSSYTSRKAGNCKRESHGCCHFGLGSCKEEEETDQACRATVTICTTRANLTSHHGTLSWPSCVSRFLHEDANYFAQILNTEFIVAQGIIQYQAKYQFNSTAESWIHQTPIPTSDNPHNRFNFSCNFPLPPHLTYSTHLFSSDFPSSPADAPPASLSSCSHIVSQAPPWPHHTTPPIPSGVPQCYPPTHPPLIFHLLVLMDSDPVPPTSC
eukprot:753953-Hanusia_phi.AAC.9